MSTETSVANFNVKKDHYLISSIGIIHGLASNDELLLLFTLSLGINNFFQLFIGLLIFTLGVVIGMISFALIIKLPLSKANQEQLVKGINLSIAIITLAYGVYLIFGGETINLLPIGNISGFLYIIAFLLGIKHSLDADHVVAISSILLRSPTIKRTITLAAAWALGHMITASIITFILFTFKEAILAPLLDNFEIIVAIMLIIIAILTILWELDIITIGKKHHHHPGIEPHTHD